MKQGWEIKKLGEVCDILDSQRKPVTKKDRKEGQYPYYGATGIQDYVDSYIFDGRYLLLGEDGAKWGAMDKSAFIIEGKSWVNNHAHILKVHDCLIDTFAEYYLVFKDLDEYITGAIVRKLTQQALRDIPMLVPPIAEQEKIVAELDCLSGIIEKKKQQLKELDNLAQSIFYEMFGDPVENDKGWNVFALSKNVKVKGRVGWKGYKKEDLRDSGPLAIGGGHLTDSGGVDLSSPVFLSMEKYLESPEIMVEVGDIILVQRGTIGKVGLIANDIGMATINPCVLILRPENLNSIYLLHYFLNESIQTHLKTLIKGVAQPMITQQQVNGLLLPMPPLYLQQDFASKIESIEKQKELIAQSIKETETLFNSRMDYYFN